MNIIISNSSSIPIYEQIKQAIKQAILKNDLKISFLTVKKAYDELEQEGYVKSVQGKGSFVAPKNSEFIQEEKRKEIQNYIEKIVKLAQMSDISEQEIIELFKLMYKGEI